MRPIENLLGKRLPPDGSLGLSKSEVDDLDDKIKNLSESVTSLIKEHQRDLSRNIEIMIELDEWRNRPFSMWLHRLFHKH